MMKIVVCSCMWIFMLFSIFAYGEVIAVDEHSMTTAVTGRLLKETGDGHAIDNGLDDTVNLEDYRPNDPSPSSKASVRPRPIEHGAPVMPYIPTPKPPSPPNHSGDDESDDSDTSPSGHSDDDGSDP